ncbi:hypothetical protein GCM10023224_48330 [Streptomonospora halophila]|uniref:Uncharacterized protein n=1 Tax=Streptomonospora halophila TaxID=427369 RepID=A0ABP9GZI9_9ACTN
MQPTTRAAVVLPASGRSSPGTADILRAVVGCAASVLLAAGCAAGPGASTGSGASASPGASAAPPATDREQAALDAYTAMWEEAAAASHQGGGDTGELDRYATGAALLLLSEALAGADGTEVTGEPVLDPEVEIESKDRASVTDCLDDSGWNLGAGPATAAGPRKVEAGLVHDGLVWRVSEMRIWEPGTC